MYTARSVGDKIKNKLDLLKLFCRCLHNSIDFPPAPVDSRSNSRSKTSSLSEFSHTTFYSGSPLTSANDSNFRVSWNNKVSFLLHFHVICSISHNVMCRHVSRTLRIISAERCVRFFVGAQHGSVLTSSEDGADLWSSRVIITIQIWIFERVKAFHSSHNKSSDVICHKTFVFFSFLALINKQNRSWYDLQFSNSPNNQTRLSKIHICSHKTQFFLTYVFP